MLQLNPPVPMLALEGERFARILIDHGPESDLYWPVSITDTGMVRTFSNHELRAAKNITLGRTRIGPIPAAAAAGLQSDHRIRNGRAGGPSLAVDHPSRQGASS